MRILLLLLILTSTAWAEDTYKLQVITKDMTEVGEYQDAQYYTCSPSISVAECIQSHQEEIAIEKEKRLANYVSAVKNPAPVVPPTKEQLSAEKSDLVARIAALDEQIKGK